MIMIISQHRQRTQLQGSQLNWSDKISNEYVRISTTSGFELEYSKLVQIGRFARPDMSEPAAPLDL